MDVFSIALIFFEIFTVVIGIFLLYWWTNKEAIESSAEMPNYLTEQDVMNNMV